MNFNGPQFICDKTMECITVITILKNQETHTRQFFVKGLGKHLTGNSDDSFPDADTCIKRSAD